MTERRQDQGGSGRWACGSVPQPEVGSPGAACDSPPVVRVYRGGAWILVCAEHRRVSFLAVPWAARGPGRFAVAQPDGLWEGDIEAPLPFDPPQLHGALERIWSRVVPSGWPLMVFVRLRAAMNALPRAWGDPWPLWAEHEAVTTTGCTLDELKARHTIGPPHPLIPTLTPGSREWLGRERRGRHEALGFPWGAHLAGCHATRHCLVGNMPPSERGLPNAIMPCGKYAGWRCDQVPDAYLVAASRSTVLRPPMLGLIWQELHLRFPTYYPPPGKG
jgi:hypothetical protein